MDAQVFSALAEPSRLRIVELLRQRPRSVNEVAQLLDIRQPQASKHLRVLSDAGLVARQPQAQQRIYALRLEKFNQLGLWINNFIA